MENKNLQKPEYLRQSIEMADGGSIEWVTGIFLLLILSIVMCTQLQVLTWQAASVSMEDALAASNLASAIIDVETYGKNHTVLICEPERAYQLYLDALKGNLQLDENWQCKNKDLISGTVKIEDYVIYNVVGDRVVAYRMSEDGEIADTFTGRLGEVKAPNQVEVECSGIYSEISFPIKGFLNVEVMAHKGQLVDVCAEEGE